MQGVQLGGEVQKQEEEVAELKAGLTNALNRIAAQEGEKKHSIQVFISKDCSMNRASWKRTSTFKSGSCSKWWLKNSATATNLCFGRIRTQGKNALQNYFSES